MPADAAPTERECNACESGMQTLFGQDARDYFAARFRFFKVRWAEVKTLEDLKLILMFCSPTRLSAPIDATIPAPLARLLEEMPFNEEGDQP